MAKKKINKQVIVTGIIVILLGIFAYGMLQVQTDISKTTVERDTPSPTNSGPIFSNIDKNLTKITFPLYRISFQIESQYLTPNYYQNLNVNLNSPDRKDNPNGETISGVAGEISISKGWDGFSNERPENKPYWSMFVIDNSFLPINNPLITLQTTRGYSKGSPSVEVKLETKSLIGYDSRFTIICYDASNNRCPQIEKTILSTLQIEK